MSLTDKSEAHLLNCTCSDCLSFADVPNKNKIRSWIESALKNTFEFFNKKVSSQTANETLFRGTFDAMLEAVNTEVKTSYNEPLYGLKNKLIKSAWVFSAQKTQVQADELAKLLVDENGKTRSWSKFKKLSKSVVKNYNETWLKTEYNHAVDTARGAVQWQKHYARRDVFPNLKYMPSVSALPREVHRLLYGKIAPVDSAFWNTYYPPSAWGCKCDVEPTDEEPNIDENDLPDLPDMPSMFKNNAGKTGLLFGENNPYEEKLGEKASEAAINKSKDWLAKYDLFERLYESKGYVERHLVLESSLLDDYKALSDAGDNVRLLPAIKTSDMTGELNGKSFTYAVVQTSTESAVVDALQKGTDTGANIVVVNVDAVSDKIIEQAIASYAQKHDMPTVILMKNGVKSITNESK